MNKRLVDLHNQTMNWVADNGSLRISDRIPAGYTEKFAELIMKECFDVVINDGRFHDAKGIIRAGKYTAMEHFGVEE